MPNKTHNESAFSFMPANGCIDVKAENSYIAKSKLCQAFADERVTKILKEYDVEIDWFDPHELETAN